METQNHYRVLGLERTADERTVKKAYFTLVRRFPPDTHPEEFKKIRAAYEVLSDPVARKRYDAADPDYREYGESVGGVLRAAADAFKAGKEQQAQQYLDVLLTQHPDLVVAREMLGQSYLRAGDFKKALAEFDALVGARPDEASHHLYRGYALQNLDQGLRALEAFKRARELRPEDVEIRIALSDSLAGAKRYDEALAEIAGALAAHPDEPGARLALELRKLDVLFLRGGGEPAWKELDAFVSRMRKDPDKDFWKYVSSQLAALAARLFGRQQFADANAVLARCQKLNPGSLVEHPYPDVVTLEASQLPEVTRAWLRAQEPGANSPTLGQSAWGGTLFGLLGASALAVFTVYALFDSPRPWGAGGLVLAAASITLSVVAMTLCVRALSHILTSDMPALVTVHPLYLLRSSPRRLKAWPLVNLKHVNLTRHSTNGVYTYTAVEAGFGKTKFTIQIRNEGYAKGWADYLLECRRRMLDLMHHGFLEAEQGADLLPPRLLATSSHTPLRARVGDRWLQAAAAASVVLFAAAIPWNRRLVEETGWREVVRQDSVSAYRRYLDAHPEGRFAGPARDALFRRYDAALADFEALAPRGARGPVALAEGIRALQERSEVKVPVLLEAEIAPEALADPSPALRAALGPEPEARRARDLIRRLQEALDQAGIGAVVRLERVKVLPEGAPLALTVRQREGLDDSVFDTGTARLRGLRTTWDAGLVVRGEAEPRFTWSGVTEPPAEIVRPAPKPGQEAAWAAALYETLAARADDELSERILAALGLGSPMEAGRLLRATQSYARPPNESPY